MEKCARCFYMEKDWDRKMIRQHKTSMEGTEAASEYIECKDIISCDYIIEQVFVLLSVQDTDKFTDYYGENAGEQENIEGVFSTKKGAEDKKRLLEVENSINVDEYGCDPVWYKIIPWKVDKDEI